jgi:hypothetical protein
VKALYRARHIGNDECDGLQIGGANGDDVSRITTRIWPIISQSDLGIAFDTDNGAGHHLRRINKPSNRGNVMTTHRVANVFGLLVGIVSYFASPSAWSQSEAPLNLVGLVFVVPVDDRRMIVAVDTNKDGVSDHLFLYVASEKPITTLRLRSVYAKVEYHSGQRLLLTPSGGFSSVVEFLTNGAARSGTEDGSTIRFEKTIGLFHYVPTNPLTIKDLETPLKVGDCKMQPQSCWEVAGQFLPFPG